MSQALPVSADVAQQFAGFFQEEGFRPYAWLLYRKLAEGHVCIAPEQLQAEADTLPERYRKLLAEGRCTFRHPALVGSEHDLEKPFVLHQGRLYLQRYFNYETTCVRRIRRFVEAEQAVLPERQAALLRHRALIAGLFADHTGAQPHWQLAAAVSGALQNLTLITGGPGTGKTTTVARLLAVLYALHPDLRVALAAPTGKAAARMAESLRRAALPGQETLRRKFDDLVPSTLHRLLKVQYRSPYFYYNAHNPLPFDVVITDESSMIDVALFAKLLQAIGPETRLILLGDKNQLASVEAGSIFGDLCSALDQPNQFSPGRRAFINSFIADPQQHLPEGAVSAAAGNPLFEHLVELQVSHRFRDDAGIGQFSKALIRNDVPILQRFLENNADPQVQVDTAYDPAVFENFIAGYEACLREPDTGKALQLLARQRVLVVTRQGMHGLQEVNIAIEQYFLRKGLLNPVYGHYENRPVILTRNYPEHGLFNGDTGLLRRDAEGVLRAWFEEAGGGLKAVLPGYLYEAETAFAMTVHKSQGSEFDAVLFILPEAEELALLTRELLYTAVTRARQKVIVQGPADILLAAAGRRVERASGIHERF